MIGKLFLVVLLFGCVQSAKLRVDLQLNPKFRKISNDFNCVQEGFFNHKTDCNKFIRCTRYSNESKIFTPFEFECAAGTIWDSSADSCVFGRCHSSSSKPAIKETAGEPSSTAGGEAPSAVDTAGPDTVAAVDTAGTDTAAAVDTAGSDTVAAVDTAGTDAAAAVDTAGSETASAVDTAGADTAAAAEVPAGDTPATPSDGPSSAANEEANNPSCGADTTSYVVSVRYCNLFYKCNKRNERYVCNPGSAFDESNQICLDSLTHPQLCKLKEVHVRGSALRSDLPNEITALIPLLKSPVQNSESYKLITFNSQKTYGPKGLEAWVLPLDPNAPSYNPLRAEMNLNDRLDMFNAQHLEDQLSLFEVDEYPSSIDPSKFSTDEDATKVDIMETLYGDSLKGQLFSPPLKFSLQSPSQNYLANLNALTNYMKSISPSLSNYGGLQGASNPIIFPLSNQHLFSQQSSIPYQINSPQPFIGGSALNYGQVPGYSMTPSLSSPYASNIRFDQSSPILSPVGSSSFYPGNAAIQPSNYQNYPLLSPFGNSAIQPSYYQPLYGQSMLGQSAIGSSNPGNSFYNMFSPYQNSARLQYPLIEIDPSEENKELEDDSSSEKVALGPSSPVAFSVSAKTAQPQSYNIVPFPGERAVYNSDGDYLAIPIIDPASGQVHYAAYEI